MSTKIILTMPVDQLGAEGDTVDVADGYARNFLYPKGLAVPATPGNMRRTESLRQKRAQEEADRQQQARDIAAKLEKHACAIARSAGPDRRLFGSVSAADIAEALNADGFEVDRKQIVLEHPIRELGVFEVDVKLHPHVIVKLKVQVESAAAGSVATTERALEAPAFKTPKSSKKK
jgi:large subunit ribosomal protein L9